MPSARQAWIAARALCLAATPIHLLGDAVQGSNSPKDDVLPYIHRTTFRTIYGDVSFAAGGEWGACCRQYHDIKGDAGIDLFHGMA